MIHLLTTYPRRVLDRLTAVTIDRADAALGLPQHKAEEGGSTVEFVILFPMFLALFISSFEASLLLTRQIMLERGVDMATRDLRLDANNTITQNQMRNMVCDNARILPDCRENLLVELTEIDTVLYDLPDSDQPCVNRETSVTPPADWETDRAGKLILMRACFAVSPFMPGAGLATELVTDEDSTSIRMVAATAFVVEP